MSVFISWAWLIICTISLVTFTHNLFRISGANFWNYSIDTFRKHHKRCMISAWVVLLSPLLLMFA